MVIEKVFYDFHGDLTIQSFVEGLGLLHYACKIQFGAYNSASTKVVDAGEEDEAEDENEEYKVTDENATSIGKSRNSKENIKPPKGGTLARCQHLSGHTLQDFELQWLNTL